jgi:pilus assembly protein CpaE
MYRDKSGVEVLLAPPRIEMAEMITPRDIERIMSLMRKVYNVVVIDTATTVDDIVLSYFDSSDVIVQIVNYEWMAMQRTRAMAETLEAINIPASHVRYLVNRADSSAGLPRDALTQAIGRAPDFDVVSDGPLVLEANNRGQPIAVIGPNTAIARDIERVATELTRTMEPAGRHAAGAAAQ